MVLKFLLGIVYFVVSLSIAAIIGYDNFQMKLLILLLFNQFLLSLILYMRSNISALQYFTTDSLISVLDRTLMIIIVGILLWGHITDTPFKIEWFVYSQTAAYTLTALITFIILNSKIEKVRLNFDFSFFLVFLKKSYPYALLILLMTFYYRIDSVMIERMLPDGKEQAGIYAQSFRILDAVSMIAFLFSTLLLPMFSRMIIAKDNISGLLSLSFHLIIVPALIFSITSYFYSKQIISLLYYSHINESSEIFSLLMISFVFISTSYIYGTLLTANGSIKELNYIAAGGMIVNIILNLILIPEHKALGATIASVITQGLTALLQVYYTHKIFNFGYHFKKVLKLIVYTFLVIAVTFVLQRQHLYWITEYFTIIFVAILTALILKIVDIKGMFRILKGAE